MRRQAQIATAATIIAGSIAAFAFRERLAADSLTVWVASFGLAAPIVFIAARALGAIVLVPGSVMGIAAGAAFGVAAGAVYNLVASTIGAVAAFAIARFLAGDSISRRIRKNGMLDRLVSGVEQEGWRFVAFVRLVPLFPYNVVNYAFGLTRIGLWPYTIATFVCMIPGDLAYVYMGYAAREALAGNERAWRLALTALAGLAALALLPSLVRRLSRR